MFRDEASLAANPNLWKEIERALDASEYYILLASPPAAASYWVRREAERWMQTKPNDHLFLALTDGSIVWDHSKDDFDWDQTTALPPTLRGTFKDQPPLWVDLRWAREAPDLSLSDPRFTDAVVSLAAPIHGQQKDELAGEEVRQNRRTIRIVRAAVLTLLILTVLALAGGIVALLERNNALHQAAVAQSRQLAAEAEAELGSNPENAISLAAQGVGAQQTPQAMHALWHALESSRLRLDLRQPSPIETLAFSPDGRYLATGADDGAVRLVRVTDGRRLWLQGRGDYPVSRISFSRAGDLLIVARSSVSGPGCSVESLNAASGSVARRLESGPSCGPFVGFLGATRMVMVGDATGAVRLWDANSGRKVGAVRGLRPPSGGFIGPGEGSTFTMAARPDGHAIAAAGNDNVVRVVSVPGGRSLATITGQSLLKPDALAFSPDGSRLMIASRNAVVVDDLRYGQVNETADEVQQFVVQSVAWSPNGRLFAAAAGDIRAWSPMTNRLVDDLHAPSSLFQAVAFSDQGMLAAGSVDGSLRIWSPDPDLPTRRISYPGDMSPVYSGAARKAHLAVVGDASSGVIVTDDNGRPLRRLTPNGSNAFAVTGDGRLAFFRQGALVFLGLRSGKVEGSQPLPSEPESFDVSADGRVIAALAADGTLTIRSGTTTRSIRVATNPDLYPTVQLSPDGRLAALTGVRGSPGIAILRTANLRASRAEAGSALAFSPSGQSIAIQRPDLSIVVMNAADWRTEAILRGATNVAKLSFSPDGRLLAADAAGTLRTWDARDGTLLKTTYVIDDIGYSASNLALSPPILTAAGFAVVGNPDKNSVDTYDACVSCLSPHVLLSEAHSRLRVLEPRSIG